MVHGLNGIMEFISLHCCYVSRTFCMLRKFLNPESSLPILVHFTTSDMHDYLCTLLYPLFL